MMFSPGCPGTSLYLPMRLEVCSPHFRWQISPEPVTGAAGIGKPVLRPRGAKLSMGGKARRTERRSREGGQKRQITR